MAEIQIQGKDGKSVGTHNLSKAIAEAKVNQVTAHRAVVAEEANKRQGTQSAKTRSEVRGGGRKPYKQKKTGNARQGTVSAPHYTHGGMAMAVKPRDYEKKINKKERRAALLGALAAHLEAGNVSVIDAITNKPKAAHKSRALVDFIETMAKKMRMELSNIRKIQNVVLIGDRLSKRRMLARNTGDVTAFFFQPSFERRS